MDAVKFEETMKLLLAEFDKSGMTMDDFIKSKLSAFGREDAEQCTAEISATLAEIDKKHQSLQTHKSAGGNREEWLRKEVDNVAKDFSTEDVGKFLSSTIKVLNGEGSDIPDQDVSYDTLDAAFIIRKLDDALVKNTCSGLMEEK